MYSCLLCIYHTLHNRIWEFPSKFVGIPGGPSRMGKAAISIINGISTDRCPKDGSVTEVARAAPRGPRACWACSPRWTCRVAC